MDLLAAWLLFPLVLGVLFLGWGLLLERLSGRRLPGVLLLPVGLAGVLVGSRLAVVSEVTVDFGLPALALGALIGLALCRVRLRALRPDPYATAAALGVALVIGAPVFLSGEPTFAGSLVLGDTAHQLALAARLSEAGTAWESLSPSSYSLTVRKYFLSAYPLGPQAALGLLAPIGLQDLAWLYQPFLAMMGAAGSLALNALMRPWIAWRRGRALVAFVAAQPVLVVAFALQGSIKELVAVAMISLAFALATLAVRERWGALAFVPLALAGVATIGALGPVAVVYVGPPAALAAGVCAWRARGSFGRKGLIGGGAAVVALVLIALPLLGGAVTAVKVGNQALASDETLGNLAQPLDILQASGAWLTADYRYPPPALGLSRGIAIALCLVGLLGLVMAIRRRSLGPLLVAGTLAPVSALLLWKGSAYADAKVLVLASVVMPLLAMSAGVWLASSTDRRWRLPGTVLTLAVAGVVLAGNAFAYHGVLLAPYDRYEEQISIAEDLKGRGPVVFAEYDEFAKHFMRDTQVLSQPEWPFEFPFGPLNVKGAPTHIQENRDGLHPSFKSALDPDGITPSTLQVASYLVMRRSPTASRPPANYKLVRTGRYYEVWERERSGERVTRHLPFGVSVFEPASRPPCDLVLQTGHKAARVRGARLAYVEREPAVMYDPAQALAEGEDLGFAAVEFKLYPSSVAIKGAGKASAVLRVPRTGRYQVWVQGSFSREVEVLLDGRSAGKAKYELANQGAYLRLEQVRLVAGPHRLEVRRAGSSLHPGNGGGVGPNLVFLGPVVLSPAADVSRGVRHVEPEDAASLCGRRLDWLEVVRPF